MRKIVEFIFFFMLIVGIFSFLYVSRPSTDYFLSKSVHHFISTSDFEAVHSEYIGKVIDIKGVVDNIDQERNFTNITLDDFFLFSIETINLTKEIAVHDELVIKGRYEGYNDGMMGFPGQYSFTDCSVK